MSSFSTITPGRPVRIVQVGAGGMGRVWLRTIAEHPDAELVGLVDLDEDAARAALDEAGLTGVAVGRSSAEVARETEADAIVNVTVPEAHLVVNKEALEAGFPVLCEKPAAPSVSTALMQTAIAERSGELLMISQSRRYFSALREMRRQAAQWGEIGTVATEFFKAPHFGGFRDQMDHVLLVDMAIHPFDAARLVIGQEPVSVYCEEYNPGWSWYAGAANAPAVFEFDGGTRYIYNGSWCSPGQETSWNGSWRVATGEGSIVWDGNGDIQVQGRDEQTPRTITAPAQPQEIAGSLTAFIHALRTGERPENDAVSNIHSLAMVEAAVLSAEKHERVMIDSVIEQARLEAIEKAPDAGIRQWLETTAAAELGVVPANR